MILSDDLATSFAKEALAKDKEASTLLYGTAKYYEDGWYVAIDGSESLVPVNANTTVKFVAGNRVIVIISDHRANVIGNLSDVATSSSETESLANTVGSIEGIDDEILEYINLSITAMEDQIESINFNLNDVSIRMTQSESNISDLQYNFRILEDKIDSLELNLKNTQNDIEAIKVEINNIKEELGNGD